MSIGIRLREERERLGMSQPEFADWVNVTKKTLFSWENGKTAPDCFQLAAFAPAGVDVLYVLTGIPLESHARLAVKRAVAAEAADRGGDFEAIRAAGIAHDAVEDAIRRAQIADRDGFLALALAWPKLSKDARRAIVALTQPAIHGSLEASATPARNTRIKVSAPGGYAAGRDMTVNSKKGDHDDKAKSRKPARLRGGA